jgi:hypothetical protein
MNKEEATNFVIQELGKHHSRNDTIQKLCEATSMNWEQAEKFIREVETQNRSAIAQKQSPIITILGTFTILAGLGLSLWIAYATMQGWVILFLSFPVPYLGNITYFVIGIGMVAGGLRGMWETITRIWNS